MSYRMTDRERAAYWFGAGFALALTGLTTPSPKAIAWAVGICAALWFWYAVRFLRQEAR